MAIYHNSVSVIKRSAGKSSVAAAAYRSGQKLTDEQTGIIHDYSRKSGVDYSIILSPVSADWITDRQQLWNRVEEVEKRGDSQLARDITLAIPRELNREDKIKLVCEYVQTNFVNMGMVADINFHEMNSDNPHAHIMMTLRDLKIDEQKVVSFGNKNREWNKKNLLIKNRADWAKITNKYLAEAGYPDIQIDHRSNADRGIEAVPQIHLGFHVAAMRKKGMRSERGDEYDRILIANDNIRQRLEQIYASESVTRDLENELAQFDLQVIIPPEVSDREQGLKDRDFLLAARNNRELRKTLEYQEAKERDKSRFYEKIEIKEVTKPTPVPAVKERITLYQKTDPQLVRSILETGNRLGTDCYQAGNYHVQISPKEISVRHQNNLAVIIGISSCLSLLIDRDRAFTLNQYEQNLKTSINVLMTDLEQQQEQAKEEKQQRQAELQPEQSEQLEQSQQTQPELKLSQDISNDLDFSIDNSEIYFTKPLVKPLVNKNLSRSDWHR
mgnify:CR=1 FL=1